MTWETYLRVVYRRQAARDALREIARLTLNATGPLLTEIHAVARKGLTA